MRFQHNYLPILDPIIIISYNIQWPIHLAPICDN